MCTGIRFTSADGKMYFGHNLDWGEQFGQTVYVTPKGWEVKYQFLDAAPTKSAIIGTAITFEGFPLYFDCGNAEGLACAGLNFPGYAQYEADAISGKTSIAAYEFPLWVCANFATVDEVEAALKNVAIVSKAPSPQLGVSLLHWIIGDATRSIVVEYMPDGMHIHHNEVDVLTNQPTFDWHMENLRNYMNCAPKYVPEVTWDAHKLVPFGGGANMRGIPGDYYSPSRFVKVAYLNANYPAQDTEAKNVSRLFHTLGNVSMVEGASIMENGQSEFTLYTGCYSAATQSYYFSTYEDATIRCAHLADYANASADAVIEAELHTS